MECLIGLGSNLGDREATIRNAIERLQSHPEIVVESVSSLHETQPVGGPAGQGLFLNAAARLTTELSPSELLDVLHSIEDALGRTREVHCGPRTIDLDLLLYGDVIVREPTLEVPHPRMHERPFVLAPAAEIAGEMVHPVLHRSIRELWTALGQSP